MSDCTQRVIDFIARQLGKTDTRDEIKPDTTLAELGADSLDVFELMMEVEDEFDVEIPLSEMNKIITVQDLINCVEPVSA